MAIEITTSGKWIKIVEDGKDPIYYSDRRAVVGAYAGTNKVYVRPTSNKDGALTIDATAANTLNGVALPTNPDLLAQKLLDEVFFLTSGSNGLAVYEEFQDFINSSVYSPFTSQSNGTGASVGQTNVNAATRPGVLFGTTGSTNTGRAGIISSLSALLFGGGVWSLTADIQLPNLSDGTDTYQFIFGFGDNATARDQTDGAYMVYDQAVSPNWQIVTANNGTRTTTVSSVAVTTSWVKLSVVVNAAGTLATFFVNGVSIGTISTNIPTASGREFGMLANIIKSVGTNGRVFYIDYMWPKCVLTTPR